MKFSTKSRYALRLMAELARYAPGTTVSLKEISERQNLSLKYLEQIVTPLARVDKIRRKMSSINFRKIIISGKICKTGNKITACADKEVEIKRRRLP
mgnify:CR=1 FL=1